MSKTTRITISLSADLYEKVANESKKQHRSKAGLVVVAVDEYFKNKEQRTEKK